MLNGDNPRMDAMYPIGGLGSLVARYEQTRSGCAERKDHDDREHDRLARQRLRRANRRVSD